MAVKTNIDTSRDGLLFVFGNNLNEFVKEAGVMPKTEKGKARVLETIELFSMIFADIVERIMEQDRVTCKCE